MNQKTQFRRLLCGAVLAALSVGMSAGASGMALPDFPADGSPGKTTVGVQTADVNPAASLSFTVPLYLTVAAIETPAGDPAVVVPDGYALRNTTGSAPDGTYPDIAVTGVRVYSVPGGTWSLKQAPTAAKDIALTIGGLTLPDLAANAGPVEADLTAAESAFYAAGRFTPFPGGPAAAGVSLPITGTLGADFVGGTERAAAQFRVKYTVSLLDGSGAPLGMHYDGPSKEETSDAVSPPGP